jgi:hypothetical protein
MPTSREYRPEGIRIRFETVPAGDEIPSYWCRSMARVAAPSGVEAGSLLRGDRLMTSEEGCLLTELVSAEVGSVVFVRDYVQVGFEAPFAGLSAYVWPIVEADGKSLAIGAPGYRDALCALIGDTVSAGTCSAAVLGIEFASGRRLLVSLDPEDAVGPEAAMLRFEVGGRWNVW